MLSRRFPYLVARRWRWIETANLLVLAVTLLAGFFILTGTWVAVVALAALTAIGTEGVLRSHPAGRVRAREAVVAQVLTPVGFAVAAALFFRWVATGYWGVPGALLTGLLFAGVLYASYFSLDVQGAASSLGRTVLVSAAYAGLFALLAVYYTFDLSAWGAALLTGVAAALFSVEVFREAELPAGDLALYSAVSGLALAQSRWAAGYVRLDGLLAAMLLLLAFYVGTGVVLAALTRRLDRRVALEFASVGAAGLLIVVIGRLVIGS
jgi:hypothetical protein